MHSNALVAGYRFNDLKRARIISSRGDLFAKQRDYSFPKPVKLSARAAWWPAAEVYAWLETRMALRNNPDNSNDESAAPAAPSAKQKQRGAAPRKPVKSKSVAAA